MSLDSVKAYLRRVLPAVGQRLTALENGGRVLKQRCVEIESDLAQLQDQLQSQYDTHRAHEERIMQGIRSLDARVGQRGTSVREDA